MRRTWLLAVALLAAGCASPASAPVPPPAARGLPAAGATAAAPPSAGSSSQRDEPGTSVTCSLPADLCAVALRAVETVPALEAAGMPPLAVRIVDMSECATVKRASPGYDLCAAPILPAPPGTTGAASGGDALAWVTYRDGLGTAFVYLWWWVSPTGRGPANAILVAVNDTQARWHGPGSPAPTSP